MNNNLDFSIEKVEIETPKIDNSDVSEGCWGDSGSDWANAC
ncbi:hypothetical protein [Leptotrichia trevisanii]|nr:hypothetical protein [Leptotrichia trevisanii]